MALTNKGYVRESFPEILDRLESKAKTLFGEDANTGKRSALGFVLRVMAWGMSLAWQDNENVFNSAYLATAEGAQLDKLLPYAGISRNPASAAYGVVIFTGEPGTLVPLGTLVARKDDKQYYTIEQKTLTEDGTATIEVLATELGSESNADIGEISELLTTVEGIDGVTNPYALANGRERESDVEVRKRAYEAIEGLGSSTIAAIRTALLKNQDIRAIYIDENVTTLTNEYGTPPHSFQAFVLGGDAADVAQTILDEKPAGIQAYGQEQVMVKDDSGDLQQIGFTYSEIVQVFAKVRLSTNAQFEADGHDQVRNAMIAYVGGLDVNDVAHTGLSLGEDVVLTKLIAAIYAGVKGINDVQIELSTDNVNFTMGNLSMARPQIAQLSANAIEVI